MTLTRRDVHKGLFSLLLLGGTRVHAATAPVDVTALNRLTFGATPAARAAMQQMGLENWLEAELAKPAHDPVIDDLLGRATLQITYEAGENENGTSWEALDEMRPLNALSTPPKDLLNLLDFEQPFDFSERIRPANEVVAASLIRAVNTDAQLREVMTAFWHEHFSVNAYKDEATAIYFPAYDTMLRGHALGNFRAMLGDVARAPAMLSYLNNDASRASPANENFARELLELHTLGIASYHNDLYDNWRDVPGALDGLAQGYIDQDVYEVARAFTGWSIGDGRWLADGVHAPRTGVFHYAENWHDPYQKRVLGVEFAPNRGPMADGEQVLDLLALHPGTARHVTRKMLVRLGIENPSEAYQTVVADSFLRHADAPDQIAQVLRILILHEEFQSTPPTKMRRPFEFLAAIYRASGAKVSSPSLDFDWHLTRAGWTQHGVKPPTGHSDQTADWANTRTLNGMVGLALYAHEDWMDGQDQKSGTPHHAGTIAALATQTEQNFAIPAGTVRRACEVMGIDLTGELPAEEGGRDWMVSVIHAAAALHPDFVLR